jgi:hypothetical protein
VALFLQAGPEVLLEPSDRTQTLKPPGTLSCL